MADNLKPEDRRKAMKAVKGKGTRLERRLFSMLAGMRVKGWKRHVSALPGKPDAAFPAQKVAVFVDGCFWHGCPYCKRKLPVANKLYWEKKIERNIELTKIYKDKLINDGWTVIRIWEHEMKNNVTRKQVRNRLREALERERK